MEWLGLILLALRTPHRTPITAAVGFNRLYRLLPAPADCLGYGALRGSNPCLSASKSQLQRNAAAFLRQDVQNVVGILMQIGVNPVLTTSANLFGGVMGKLISPQSIAVACAATGLVSRETDIFRCRAV